jgi:hypothetical protein
VCVAAKLVEGDDDSKLTKTYISTTVRDIAQQFGIRDTDVITYETDRGSNMNPDPRFTQAAVVNCSSHRLNNIAQKAIKESGAFEIVQNISNVNGRFRRSNKASALLNKEARRQSFSGRLPVHHNIRWNSALAVMNSFSTYHIAISLAF